MNFQKILLNTANFLSQRISKVHAPFSRKKFTGQDFWAFKETIQIGDIISTKSGGELSNLFIPGFFGHVAMVISPTTVIEATTHGVVETDLYSFLIGKDYVAISRDNFLTIDQKIDMVVWLKEQLGKPYDFEFATSDISKFYCSELMYMAIKQVTGKSPFKLKKILGQETIDPSDFFQAKKLFNTIWMNEALRAKEV